MSTTADDKQRFFKVVFHDQKTKSRILLIENFLGKERSSKIMKRSQDLPYGEEPGMFGKPCLRKTISFGQYDNPEFAHIPVKYPYAKKVDIALPFSQAPEEKELLDECWSFYYDRVLSSIHQDQEKSKGGIFKEKSLSSTTTKNNHPFKPNYDLVNFYPHKKSVIGWHADDESVIVNGSPIFSYSLGIAKIFSICPKNLDPDQNQDKWFNITLTNDSLLVMEGPSFQDSFYHSVRKAGGQRGVDGIRVNRTFRAICEPKKDLK